MYLEDETGEEATKDAALLLQAAELLPRQMDRDATAAWVRSQGALSPRDKRLLNRGRFMGANLVGSELIQRLSKNDVHKATGEIPHLTPAELTSVFDQACITGNAPEFEEAVVDGETLYDLFTTQSFEAVVGDYFQTDVLRPLAKKLWAVLAVIDNASRARDADRIFCILTPLLADLQDRQDKGDAAAAFVKEQEELRGRQGETSNRRYAAAVAKVDSDGDDSDGPDGGGSADDDIDGTRYATGGAKDKTGGKGGGGTHSTESVPQLDLVARAFAVTAIVANEDEAGGGTAVGTLGGGLADAPLGSLSTRPFHRSGLFSGTKLSDWTTAVEKNDWNGMKTCGGLFTHVSSSYGQCIIEGRVDTGKMQVFTAKNMGGIAGGKKFVEKDILYKFADPMGGPYNSSFELSQKAAAHDLRGATAFAQHGQDFEALDSSGRGVFVSLQTIIDYGGFRLQAMQMLPIGGPSLIVGSGDACETLPKGNADPKACGQFGVVAGKLGLSEHGITVGGETVMLHFGADVEGHRGKDGNLYVLDTA